MMQTKKMLAVTFAVGGALFVGSINAAGKQAEVKKPATVDAKKDDAKKNSAAVVKDVNTNITVGDVVSKDVKIDLNVRYVNAMEAMQSSKKGAEISEGLDKKRQDLSEKIKKEEQKVQQTMTEFKSKESTMSGAARNTEEAKVVKMRRDYESLVKSSEDELKLAMQQATEELSTDVEKTISEMAKSKGYDIVADVYTGRTIYASDKAMITADLVQALDKKYEVASKKSPTKSAAAAA